VITPIGLDHLSILGPTLADIARDKARAMRPDTPAITAAQNIEVMAVLRTVAAQTGALLHCDQDVAAVHGAAWPIQPSMPGPHQAENLRLALAAYQLLAEAHSLPIDPDALGLAARKAFIPGRLQIIPRSTGWPSFILDGAHNLPGLESLIHALTHLTIKPQAVVFACLADKDIEAMLPLVRSLTDGAVIVPGIDAPGRALDPAELAGRIGGGAVPVRDMAEGFRLVKGSDGAVLVCGSLYLLAEVYKLRPQWLKRR